ncbi:hypothetical protein LJR039_006058 [Pseudorhodoferax sp. LjRoot39]
MAHLLARTAAWLIALAALACVFAMYLQPEFMVGLANQVWACF